MSLWAWDSGIIAAVSLYVVGAASPGPSNLAIMGAAMSHGRLRALAMAAGVVLGSQFWGLLAACGLAGVIREALWLMTAMKLAGGAYLLYLEVQSARQAARREWSPPAAAEPGKDGAWRWLLKGAAMHVTNPKAILVWLSIVTLALPRDGGGEQAFHAVWACGAAAVAVFCGYALVFSTAAARHGYLKLRRPFQAVLAGAFGWAGLRMLFGRGNLA
ncbi:LysE family translocator [Chromobacterium sp. IIBBL 290-4]|uniref:LysE family translocator n=1 Tax=Chromobacterium sp. IIBBL 290-4 TaxID=2953890 RepID=UPI0020B775D0|nr:LysE family translocator [Chromobacterium sp. IIBBL 290-4]UTH74644.1 LysE family translocator [Chromobacterium sp. IIBBL 290-4]